MYFLSYFRCVCFPATGDSCHAIVSAAVTTSSTAYPGSATAAHYSGKPGALSQTPCSRSYADRDIACTRVVIVCTPCTALLMDTLWENLMLEFRPNAVDLGGQTKDAELADY